MSDIEAELWFIREKGELIGISIVAGAEAYSERFCAALSQALADGSATVSVTEDAFVLTHPDQGHCTFAVSREQAAELELFLEQKGPYEGKEYQLHAVNAFTPGFKVVLAGKEDAGEVSTPIRSVG